MEVRSDADALIGTTIDETIKIESVLGAGGMGTVYKGVFTTLEKPVAVKVLSQAAAADQNSLLRFKVEAESLSALNHPNVLSIFRFGVRQEEGKLPAPYLVLELVEGGSLQDRLVGPPLKLAEIDSVFEQLASGIAAAHRVGIIHRDIKPSNIMFAGKTVKVVDFGISKSLTPTEVQKLTQTGALLGTPLYMSPEQLASQTPSKQSDVFAMGCVLFEMLYGKPYMNGENIVEIAMNQMYRPPEFAVRTTGGEAISKHWRGLLSKMLASAPADRPADAAAVREWIAKIRTNPEETFGELKLTEPPHKQLQLPVTGRAVALAAVVALGLTLGCYVLRPFDSPEDKSLRNVARLCDLAAERRNVDEQTWDAAVDALNLAQKTYTDPKAQAEIAGSYRRMASLRILASTHDNVFSVIRTAALLPADGTIAGLEEKHRLLSTAIIASSLRCGKQINVNKSKALETYHDEDMLIEQLYKNLVALNYRVLPHADEPSRDFLAAALGNQVASHISRSQMIYGEDVSQDKALALQQSRQLAEFLTRSPSFFVNCEQSVMQGVATIIQVVFGQMNDGDRLRQFTMSLTQGPSAYMWQKQFKGNELTPLIWQADSYCTGVPTDAAKAETLMNSLLDKVHNAGIHPTQEASIYLIRGKAQYQQAKIKEALASLQQGLKLAQSSQPGEERNRQIGDQNIWIATCYLSQKQKHEALKSVYAAKAAYEQLKDVIQHSAKMKSAIALEQQIQALPTR